MTLPEVIRVLRNYFILVLQKQLVIRLPLHASGANAALIASGVAVFNLILRMLPRVTGLC